MWKDVEVLIGYDSPPPDQLLNFTSATLYFWLWPSAALDLSPG